MTDRHAFADAAGAILMKMAETRLTALLAEYGVADRRELPLSIQNEVLQRAVVGTAAANFPTANLEAVARGIESFAHPAFFPALERMWLATKGGSDAFAMTRGVYAAVVLAGFGLPVAPFDLATGRILAEPSNDIDTVQKRFSTDEGAFVGYNVCIAPFYVLLTDCVRSLRRLVPAHPLLSEVKFLVERAGATLPPDPGLSFKHSMALAYRQPGDAVSTVALHDPSPTGGSVMLYAGWQVDGEPRGAPNDGFMPFPTQLLRAVVNDMEYAYSLCRPAAAPMSVH